MSKSNLVYVEDEPADGDEELDEVEIGLQRLKRNRDHCLQIHQVSTDHLLLVSA